MKSKHWRVRTKGAFPFDRMVESDRQIHTEPPSGRVSVFEKGKLVGSFESWRQAVAFVRTHHLRRAKLVPESSGVTLPKRPNPSVAVQALAGPPKPQAS